MSSLFKKTLCLISDFATETEIGSLEELSKDFSKKYPQVSKFVYDWKNPDQICALINLQDLEHVLTALNKSHALLQSQLEEVKTENEKLKTYQEKTSLMNKTKKEKLDQIPSLEKKLNTVNPEIKELKKIKLEQDKQLDELKKENKSLKDKVLEKDKQLEEFKIENEIPIKNELKNEAERTGFPQEIYELQKKLVMNQQEVLTLKDQASAFKDEIRHLKSALHLSYIRYGAINTRRLLDLLSRIIFDIHDGNAPCTYSRDHLKFHTSDKPSVSLCLTHYLKCPHRFSTYTEQLHDRLDNISTDLLGHDPSKLHEIIITEDIPESMTCFDVLKSVIKDLKEKYKDDPYVDRISEDFIVLGNLPNENQIKKFACFKAAKN